MKLCFITKITTTKHQYYNAVFVSMVTIKFEYTVIILHHCGISPQSFLLRFIKHVTSLRKCHFLQQFVSQHDDFFKNRKRLLARYINIEVVPVIVTRY